MIVDQLEDIDSSKFIFEDESQLSDINKEITKYHCLNARVTWGNSIWRLTDRVLYHWVVSRLIQRCTLSFQSSKLLFQLAFHVRLTNVFNSLLHDESSRCFDGLFRAGPPQGGTRRERTRRDRWIRRRWRRWCRRARAGHMGGGGAAAASSPAGSDSGVGVDAALAASRSGHRQWWQ